jgi:hypothetical protein
MGSFINNLHIHRRSVEVVRSELAAIITRDAFLVQSGDNWVTIYPDDHESQSELAEKLSIVLSAAVFATMVHDDDILLYSLYENGLLTDEFNSNPLYFREQLEDEDEEIISSDGSPDVLVKYALAGTSTGEIRETLDEIKMETFASEGLTSLCHLFGIDEACARASLRYVKGGELIPHRTLIAVSPAKGSGG